MPEKARNRCPWAGSDPLYVHYHDTVWGNRSSLFQLEFFQALLPYFFLSFLG